MADQCQGELSSLAPLISGCPADGETILFCNVTGQPGGYAFRSWSTVKQCIITALFGEGGITITGLDLNVSNQYIDPNMPTEIMVFYNGLGRFLIIGTEWKYINNTDTANGIQILLSATFGASDYFTILANPNNP